MFRRFASLSGIDRTNRSSGRAPTAWKRQPTFRPVLEELEARLLLSSAPLHVVGNQLEDPLGHGVVLRGVNVNSLEFRPDGDNVLQAESIAINDWHSNLIRVPVNEDIWFGHDQAWTGGDSGDGGAAYRSLVDTIISTARAANVYVMLDLHWSDMGTFAAGNDGQHFLPDNNSTLFWQSAASRYANNPAVLFDPYNEPTLGVWNQAGGYWDFTPTAADWNLWLNGGTVVEGDVAHDTGATIGTYSSPGMQGLVNTIRATGAANIIAPEGLNWGSDVTGVTTGHALVDPTGNLMYQVHLYPDKDPSSAVAVGAQHPIYVGEWGDGGVVGQPIAAAAASNTTMLSFLNTHSFSWTAWDLSPEVGTNLNLLASWNAAATTSDFGALVKADLAQHVTDQAPVLSNVSGTTINENTAYAFNGPVFTSHFSDPDTGDSLQQIKVTLLPGHGTLKLNGTAVTLNQEIVLAQLGNLTYTPDSGYHSTDSFGWNGSDGALYANAAASADLIINAPPDLSSLTDQAITRGQTRTIVLPATDADGQTVTYSATTSSPQEEAQSLQQQLNLMTYWAQFSNARGWGEKYLTDASGNWYYMLSGGALYEWAGANSSTDNTLVGELDTGYYQNPLRLVYANFTGWSAANEAAASTLQQAQGLTAYWAQFNNARGWGEEYLTDASGNWFYMLSTGAVYEWAGVSSSTGNALIGTLDSAFYQDPSRLVNSWAVVAPASNTATLPMAAQLLIAPGSFVGQFRVYVTATDGITTTRQYMWVTVNPAVSSVLTLNLSDVPMLDGDSQTLTLGPATEAGGNPITYTATIGSVQAQANDTQQSLNLTTYWAQFDNARLWGEKYMTDASGTWYYMLSSGALYKWAGAGSATGNTLEGTLDTGYYQDPDRLIYADFTGWTGTNEAAASTIEQANGMTVYWSQFSNARGWGEKYMTDASGQWYYILSTGTVYKWNGGNTSTGNTPIGTVDTHFYRDPARLVHSWEAAAPASSVVGAVSGTGVTITPGAYAGRFLVYVTASDGIATAQKYVWVTAAPDTLAGLSSIGMSHTQPRTVTLGPATVSGNPVTYTVTTSSAQGEANDAQQQVNVTTYWPGANNARGWSEKYLTNASGQWFYILPTGALYQWNGSGSSTGNTLIGTLDAGYYQDPRRLIYADWTGWNAASEAGGFVLGQAQGLTTYWAQFNNARGWGEKYMTDASGYWYYILPTGALYQWNGVNSAAGNTPIGTADTAFYQDPSRLVYSWALAAADPRVVSVNGTQLTITPGSFTGQLLLCVTSNVSSVKQDVWVTAL